MLEYTINGNKVRFYFGPDGGIMVNGIRLEPARAEFAEICEWLDSQIASWESEEEIGPFGQIVLDKLKRARGLAGRME